MMKAAVQKLRARRGETLVGLLVAILIIALSAGLFASMYSASSAINRSARGQDELLYRAANTLENMEESEDTEVTEGATLTYTPTVGIEPQGTTSSAVVDVLTQDGMSVYKAR